MSTPESSNPALRLTVLTVLVAMLLGALLSRLWFLQVLAGDRYAELAQSNEVRTVLTLSLIHISEPTRPY